jgi:hypothetical protein
MSNIAAAATSMNLDVEIDEIPAPVAEDDNNLDIFQINTTTTTKDDADQTQQQQLCPSSTGQRPEEQSLIITTTGDEDECIRSSPS